MTFEPILKDHASWKVVPNPIDYERTRAEFSWRETERKLDGLPCGRGLNIAYEAIDRHAKGPRRDHLALRWLGKENEVRDFTYEDLLRLSNRFANVLQGLGMGKGDRVFVLAGRIPELYITALGTLKNRSIFCPLFSAFGILNNAATILNMSGGQFNIPLVIRMTTGAGRQLAAQHSHSLEGWYAHIPGIKVLTPTTLEDARGMLWTALEDPDPVLIFENGLFYNMEGEIAVDAGAVDISKAAIERPGKNLSLITTVGPFSKRSKQRKNWREKGSMRSRGSAHAPAVGHGDHR